MKNYGNILPELENVAANKDKIQLGDEIVDPSYFDRREEGKNWGGVSFEADGGQREGPSQGDASCKTTLVQRSAGFLSCENGKSG